MMIDYVGKGHAPEGRRKVVSQEFCDVALDVIHYVKEHGVLQPEPKKRRVRSDKGVARGPRSGAKEVEMKDKTGGGKRKADVMAGKAPAKKGTTKVNEVQPRKKAKGDPKKAKPKAGNGKSGGVVVKPRKN